MEKYSVMNITKECNEDNESQINYTSEEEHQPFLPKSNSAEIQVYGRRWWVLALFSMSCFMQAVIWNTWGPITKSAEVVFKWQDSTIGMLANCGIISYVCTIFPACYLMDIKGLRISLLLCNCLLTLGSALRCITSDPYWATWLMNIGAILNGIAGTVPYAGPSLLASTWFPINQRATATAVASVFNYFGVGMGYIIECAASVALLLATVLYFPSKPPIPPSITASMQRVEYRKALLDVARNRYLWMLSFAYALPTGVYGVWGGAVLDIILDPLQISQTDVGSIGFYTIIAGCFSSLLIARFSDNFMRHMKIFLVCLYMISGGSFVWITLLCLKIIPYTSVQIYAACILGGMFLNGTIPLFYELCSETAYPVSEGVAGGFITLFHSLFGIIFLLILLIPEIGKSWMNYTLLGSIGVGLVFLILFPEQYTRTDIDITVEGTRERMRTDVTEHINVYNPRE